MGSPTTLRRPFWEMLLVGGLFGGEEERGFLLCARRGDLRGRCQAFCCSWWWFGFWICWEDDWVDLVELIVDDTNRIARKQRYTLLRRQADVEK